MRIEDLFTPIDSMSDEELKERIRQLRHNREVAKPVAKKAIAKAEKKETNKKMSTLEKMLDQLSPEDRAALLGGLINE